MQQLTATQREQLKSAGYVLLSGLLSAADVQELLAHLEQLWLAEGEVAGRENYIEKDARRLANLANKGEIFRHLYAHPLILAGARQVMGSEVRLSMLNARDVPPGNNPQMPLHQDTDDNRPGGFHSATAIWMLDDFTPENGATRVVPGSHLLNAGPFDVLADPAAHPDEIVVSGRAGDVLLFNGHLWHTGGANQSESHRRAILAHYLKAPLPGRDDRRQHLDPETIAELTNLERRLLGLED